MSLHYAQIRRYDVANGEGIRTSVFVTGCTLHCVDCFNVLYQDPAYGTEWSEETTARVIGYLRDPNVAGLTLLGGEPMQSPGLVPVVEEIRRALPEGKTIWVYSGYTYEQIVTDPERRRLLELCDILVDGRDIGTVVLPDADVKIFLQADVEVRARRRERELLERGTPRPFDQVMAEMKERDYNDVHRAAAPLRPAEDAVIVDTSQMDFRQSEEALLDVIRRKVGV